MRPLPATARRLLDRPLFDALTTPHGVSRFLETLHPLWTLEGGRALVTDVRAETADVRTLTLQPDHAWTGHRAGQHVRVGVVIDGTVRTRTYSVSSSAHRDDGTFTITVKRKDGGLVSGHLHDHVAPGTVVHCSPATGEVVLPDPRPDRLLLVSGGSGITPLAGMLRTLADEAHDGQVTFLHYARTADDVPFAAELAATARRLPGVEVVVALTGDDPATSPHARPGITGRFVADHLAALAPDHLEVPTFVCGPTGLVDAVEQHYLDAGSPHLQVERFTPPALRTTGPAAGGTVRFADSDVEVVDDGRSLLEQAEGAGLEPANGCRMGICHTCTRTKSAGAVIDRRTGRTSTAPDEPVQICVTVPAGDVTLEL
ncbi:ferredoxin reductase [Nitriliruptoraceae bacterium ZYF776]|nr:ferredoxin reductase [Profundirhabdus halotolerans]